MILENGLSAPYLIEEWMNIDQLTYRYIVTLSLLQIQSILTICLFKLVGGHTFSSENTVLFNIRSYFTKMYAVGTH